MVLNVTVWTRTQINTPEKYQVYYQSLLSVGYVEYEYVIISFVCSSDYANEGLIGHSAVLVSNSWLQDHEPYLR